MFDHLTLTVRDIARSKAFYMRALAPLGCAVQMEFEQFCGIGPKGKPAFWLKPGEVPTTPMHLAFRAGDRPSVDAFYAAAIAAGATDNGPPGLRTDYHPNYYGAFVIDPDGHPIEAVCHYPPGGPKPAAKMAPSPRARAKAKPKAAKAKARRPAAKRKGARRK